MSKVLNKYISKNKKCFVKKDRVSFNYSKNFAYVFMNVIWQDGSGNKWLED